MTSTSSSTVKEAQVLSEHLTYALNSRVVIEQAKGVLAERLGINMELSFSRMRSHARNHNLRLVEVAAGVVDGRYGQERSTLRPPTTDV